MKQFSYNTSGTCSKQIIFELDDEHRVHNVHFVGGCAGNTVGVSRLAEGMRAEDIISRTSGIPCGGKGTSCPDQLSKALQYALATM